MFHDMIGYLNNNWTKTNGNSTRKIEQLINIPKLVEQTSKGMTNTHKVVVFSIQSFILERNCNP